MQQPSLEISANAASVKRPGKPKGISPNAKFSPAREKTAEILALYAEQYGHKAIAKRLNASPRIVREILIERGVYKPGVLFAKIRAQERAKREERLQRESALRAAKKANAERKKKEEDARPKRITCKTGAPTGLSCAQYSKWRYDNNPQYRIKELLRQRMKKVIKRGQKKGTTLDLIGCSAAHVRAHLESQFQRGMTWDNGGTGHRKWHIDHRIPCAAFDLTDPKQQRICFHWTNLRPMWSDANMKKGSKIERHEQTQLHINY